MALLEVTNIKKIYSTRFGGNKVQALSNVTFSIEKSLRKESKVVQTKNQY